MSERWFDGTFYKRTALVNYGDCNADRRIFLHVLLGTFSEIAGDEGVQRGQNHQFFIDHGKVFMISRMSARIHRRPSQDETIVYTTWFRQTADERFFLRDCDVRTQQGELLVSMTGTWVLLDLSTRRMVGPQLYPGVMSTPFPQKVADAPPCGKISPREEGELLGIRPVYYTDLDLNSHINNAAYTRIAVDFLPQSWRIRQLKEYGINFRRETTLGESLRIVGTEKENGYIIQGFVGDEVHFASEFTF